METQGDADAQGEVELDLPDSARRGAYDEKYILVKVTRDNGTTLHRVVSRKKRYHSGVYSTYMEEQFVDSNERHQVLGGGILQIDEDARVVRTFGSSGGYGPVSSKGIEIVERALKRGFGEAYEVDAKVSAYIRD